MAITTLDGLVAALPAQSKQFLKGSFSPQATACFTSLWAVAGIPGAGSNSADGVAGAIPTDATAGAFPFTNSNSSYLARISSYSTIIGTLFLYDRLWHNSGLSPTDLGGQAVNSTALTRPDATGAGVEAWMQVYTTLGAGSTASTITYTDQDNGSPNTGTLINFATTSAANRTYQYALAAGDTGVRSIQTYTNGATMTSGTFGLILRRQICLLQSPIANAGVALDPIQGGLPRIYDDACLELIWLASATTANTIGGHLGIAQG
jgi:hypothetical protein